MLPTRKRVLHRVIAAPVENEQLKRLTRRRRQLVDDKTRLTNRLVADLQGVAPGLLEITGEIDNRWSLNFLCSRDNLSKLVAMRRSSLLKIRGVGDAYARKIEAWQKQAAIAPEAEWVGEMIASDAKRALELLDQISAYEEKIETIAASSEIATTLRSIPGFGAVCSSTLAGEIGTLDRFAGEPSLALYLGMTRLDNSSGK